MTTNERLAAEIAHERAILQRIIDDAAAREPDLFNGAAQPPSGGPDEPSAASEPNGAGRLATHWMR